MKRIQHIGWLVLSLLILGCTDWRNDAFEDKRFDVENSFIRFNYGFVLNQGPQDTVVLDINELSDTIFLSIPIAMSSPLQQGATRIQVRGAVSENEGNMQVVWPGGILQNDTTEVEIPPNELEVTLDIQIMEPEAAEILFELIANSGDFHLGFPESGAHSNFKVILE